MGMPVPDSKVGVSSTAHIVVVEDDAHVREMLRRYFVDEGFRVSTAASGRALFETLARHPADIVLLDLTLPGEDGVVVARELRVRSGIGIIMLTGRSDMVDRVVGLEVGADDYIAKPFHLREVLARVKTVLRRLRPAATAIVLPDADGARPPLRFARSEERRVGKACVRPCISRWWPYH